MQILRLPNGLTFVSDEDYFKLTEVRFLYGLQEYVRMTIDKWVAIKSGYITSSTWEMLHRLIMDCPDDMVVDHINGIRYDNRRENLRVVTQRENSNNMHTKEEIIKNEGELYAAYRIEQEQSNYQSIREKEKTIGLRYMQRSHYKSR